jgi:translation initiation factor 1
VARESKQRIPTEAGPAAFANPFAALDLGPLPDPPPAVPRAEHPAKQPPKERLLLRRSTAQRGGKTVLVLEGFSSVWSDDKLRDLLHDLKTRLGSGGKINGRALEIQGEQADRLQPLLEARGFVVKRGW